jgi:hypothetical protein
MKIIPLYMILGVMVVSLSGCVAYVRPGPPPPRYVVMGYAPGPGYVWADGYWGWNGAGYVWAPGRWVFPPRPGLVWVPAHWVRRPRGWLLVRGHWRYPPQ